MITVNGEAVMATGGESVLQLLTRLGYTEGRFAVEIDGTVVSRARLADYYLRGEERIEVVGLVGGG